MQIAEKAQELSRLGMSASAIAKALGVTDKAVKMASSEAQNRGSKATERRV